MNNTTGTELGLANLNYNQKTDKLMKCSICTVFIDTYGNHIHTQPTDRAIARLLGCYTGICKHCFNERT